MGAGLGRRALPDATPPGGGVGACIVGSVTGSRGGWLRRVVTPRQQMLDEVAARARETFFDKRIHHTSDATGLLIYVSLFEHRAVVLGDQNVMDKLGQDFLDFWNFWISRLGS